MWRLGKRTTVDNQSGYGKKLTAISRDGARQGGCETYVADCVAFWRKAMRKSILVAGGTGFIGHNLIDRLLDDDYEISVIVREKKAEAYYNHEQYSRLNVITANELFEQAGELSPFDGCFNLAAYGVAQGQEEIDKLLEGNLSFPLKLLEFCQKNKTKKFINTGSCFEYGQVAGNEKIKETGSISPLSLYGAAKAANTMLLKIYAQKYHIPFLTLRPFGTFGKYEAEYRLTSQILRTIQEKTPLALTGGEQIRDYLYAGDVAAAFLAALEEDLPLYQEYNVCSGQGIRIRDFIREFIAVSGADAALFRFGELPYRSNEQMYYVGDNTKLMKYSGWRPQTALREGIQRIFDRNGEKRIG